MTTVHGIDVSVVGEGHGDVDERALPKVLQFQLYFEPRTLFFFKGGGRTVQVTVSVVGCWLYLYFVSHTLWDVESG